MTVAERTLPWEGLPQGPSDYLEPVLNSYRRRHRDASTEVIEKAFRVAHEAHKDQVRRSGEAYIHHPLAVASIVAELGLDETSVAAALLHDAVEDTALTVEDVVAQFGEAVAEIVDGVTKLDRLSFESKEAQQAATMRKMLVAMARDWRVLIIKLCDRLHNMRTLGSMTEEKSKRIAQETLDIYAPLAHRLGMQDIKWQLEDLSFSALHPKRYAEIAQMVATRSPEREEYLSTLTADVKHRLEELHIQADVKGRPKNLWSIYEKMVVKGKEFDEIYDLVGIRLIVDSVKDCYAALGSIHATWKPIQGRFKDYIAMPKFNLYQSLHTTVIGPAGKAIEVQIRTYEMHHRAELGIAAHWSYKERSNSASNETPWLQRIVDWQEESTDPAEFLESLKLDLEQDEVFVFTPKGDVVSLAMGATPIDFAYSVHTDVGHRCIGARVNGRLAPLDSKLQSGDTVEVFTSKVATAGPSRDWLKIVVTPRARNKIRQWFSRERREDAIDNGKEDLTRSMRREGLPIQKLMGSQMLVEIGKSMNYNDLDSLYAAIGDGHVSAHGLAQRISKDLRGGQHEEQLPSTIKTPRPPRTGHTSGVHVEGLDDVMVRLSRCCTPVPGDEIIGFVTRGRGVSVHRADCANAVSLQEDQSQRLIDVEWDDERKGSFVVSIEIRSLDRPKLLLDITRVLVESHVSIHSSHSQAGPDRVSRMRFEFQLGDSAHLDSILAAIKRIDSVYDVYRIVPGHGN